jgi:hypothetical protein
VDFIPLFKREMKSGCHGETQVMLARAWQPVGETHPYFKCVWLA